MNLDFIQTTKKAKEERQLKEVAQKIKKAFLLPLMSVETNKVNVERT